MRFEALRESPPVIRFLYASTFTMSLGYYALIPYLALHLTKSLGYSMVMAGLVLGTRQLSQQGLMFLGGILADRVGWKRMLLCGLIVRGISFLLFCYSEDFIQLLASAALFGVGGAFYDPSEKAIFESLTPLRGRSSIIALRNLLANIAFVISTLIGSSLIGTSFFRISLISTIGLMGMTVAAWKIVPSFSPRTRETWRTDVKHVTRNTSFVLYTVILTGYYYLYCQLYLLIPRAVFDVRHDSKEVSLVYSVVAITVIILQLKVTNLTTGTRSPFVAISTGCVLIGISLFFFGQLTNLGGLCAMAFVFGFGTCLANPMIFDVVASFAPREKLAAYYGFNSYAQGVGGTLSTVVGGWTYDLGISLRFPQFPWIVCLAVAALVGFALYFVEAPERAHHESFEGTFHRTRMAEFTREGDELSSLVVWAFREWPLLARFQLSWQLVAV